MGIKKVKTFCLWQDLLGFGGLFKENAWQINSNTLVNLERLQAIQKEVDIRSASDMESIFALNDGVARTFDIPNNNIFLILDWVQYVIYDFYLLNHEDKQRNFPGIRGVLTSGERAILLERDIVTKDCYYLTTDEKRNEYKKTPFIYTPKHLQMNTAFSKSYIIEESGGAYNVAGSNLFIDESVLESLIDIIDTEKKQVFPVFDNERVIEKAESPFDDNEDAISVHAFDIVDLQYNLSCEIRNSDDKCELIVTAKLDHNPECVWEYFRLVFDRIISYENEKARIKTRLYIPCYCSSRLTGPSDENLFVWDINEIIERPKIVMRLSDGVHTTGKPIE